MGYPEVNSTEEYLLMLKDMVDLHPTTACFNWDDMSYVNLFDEEDGAFWTGVDFYHKANELGILDPDSFAMNEQDLKAKATAGRLMYIGAVWQAGEMEEGQEFRTKWRVRKN